MRNSMFGERNRQILSTAPALRDASAFELEFEFRSRPGCQCPAPQPVQAEVQRNVFDHANRLQSVERHHRVQVPVPCRFHAMAEKVRDVENFQQKKVVSAAAPPTEASTSGLVFQGNSSLDVP